MRSSLARTATRCQPRSGSAGSSPCPRARGPSGPPLTAAQGRHGNRARERVSRPPHTAAGHRLGGRAAGGRLRLWPGGGSRGVCRTMRPSGRRGGQRRRTAAQSTESEGQPGSCEAGIGERCVIALQQCSEAQRNGHIMHAPGQKTPSGAGAALAAGSLPAEQRRSAAAATRLASHRGGASAAGACRGRPVCAGPPLAERVFRGRARAVPKPAHTDALALVVFDLVDHDGPSRLPQCGTGPNPGPSFARGPAAGGKRQGATKKGISGLLE